MTPAEAGYPEENKDASCPELGSLRTAFRPRATKKTVCLWNAPDDDDVVEFDCEISCDSILVVIDVRGEYLRVFTESFKTGWIHKRNTEAIEK